MGSACCVAAKDSTLTNGTSSEILQRNIRYSPSWSFRWDNRGRVAGEETSMNSFSRRVNSNVGLDTKSRTVSEIAYASEEGSPLESFRTLTWQKSPTSEGNERVLRLPQADSSVSTNSIEGKVSTESLAVSDPSPTKLSPSIHSKSSLSTSPLSSQSHMLPPSSAPPRCARRSPAHKLLRQVSSERNPGFKSPNLSNSEEGSTYNLQGWSNESIRNSHGGSSDGVSTPSSHRASWVLNNENRDKISRLSSIDIQSCGVCSKNMNEISLWGGQKIITLNTTAVIAVLFCGHVYHAECLEKLTPESTKFDPACPVCTFGEKQSLRLYEKALRGELDLKVKNKQFRKQKSESRGAKMSSSSSMRSSSVVKPFLRRHFSLGSKESSRFVSDHPSTRKKGFFWSKSSKE